ncbi:MAG: HNH endonuclease [Proteobacteria bacterium]|nr:HNH endonuclease [Pseudomonadota bacterium]
MGEFDDVAGSFRFNQADADADIRSAAFAAVRQLTQLHGNLTAQHLSGGFQFRGRRIPLINPQRGIFKPQQMQQLLSIKTVYPRPGRKVWYDDQREVHQQIYNGDETVDYAFMGSDPNAADNRWLRDAFNSRTPIIYFLGTAPGLYQAVMPAFLVGFDAKSLKARVAFAPSEFATAEPQTAGERRYALRMVKQRLHQASFREMVISAYGGKCAISGLPEPLLLDAAHIVGDIDEQYGQPTIGNGIPLSKIHHAAFDAQLIGIDSDFKIHVSKKLLDLRDGPTLDALLNFHGRTLLPPRREKDRPDRDRLALRFEKFKSAA